METNNINCSNNISMGTSIEGSAVESGYNCLGKQNWKKENMFNF